MDLEKINISYNSVNGYYISVELVGGGNYYFANRLGMSLMEYELHMVNIFGAKIIFGDSFFQDRECAQGALDSIVSLYIVNQLAK